MNNNSPGFQGIVTLDKRLSKIESLIQDTNEIHKPSQNFLDEIILQKQQSIKKKKLEEEQKIKQQYNDVIKTFSNDIKAIIRDIQDTTLKILTACEHAIKFVEVNFEKIKYLYQIPLNIAIELTKSDIKLNIALEIVKAILDTLFDRETITNTINYLCRIIFPKTTQQIETNTKKKKKKWYNSVRESIR